uniref:U28-Sparatoxin-Hju1f_1 n=1 Tax=Heteropoda jugulans TaxID=1358901 RepID=A0A4V2H9G8_9ARAC
MKITIVVMLLIVVFSEVTLAELSIGNAALELVETRAGPKCGYIFFPCNSVSKCCEGIKCIDGYCSIRGLGRK